MSALKIRDAQGNWIEVPMIKGDKGDKGEQGDTYELTEQDKQDIADLIEIPESFEIHICSSEEYDSTTRIPTIQTPDEKTFYLVPTEDGTSPDLFTEWVYVNGAWEMFGSAKIDLSEYLTDVTIGGNSVVTDGIANIPIASRLHLGAIKVDSDASNSGLSVDNTTGFLELVPAITSIIKKGSNSHMAISPSKQHESTFYGLAKASGDSTQSASSNAVGAYTDEAKASIQNMLGVPSVDDIPDVPVEDVQINGTSIVSNGVANVPVANGTTFGAVKVDNYGVFISNGFLFLKSASGNEIKNGSGLYSAITASNCNAATFYGLANAAGDTTQKNLSYAVGNYTPEAKGAIQSMLGIDSLIAPTETNPFTEAHAIGDLFIINGALYKAKTAIAVGDVLNDGVNVDGVSVDDVAVKDVQINGTSVLSDGVANIPIATGSTYGVVKTGSQYGTFVDKYTKVIGIKTASSNMIKDPVAFWESYFQPVSPFLQHESVFYGLAKASGDTTQSQSDNAVGTYTDEAKASIKSMLGVDSDLETKLDKPQGTVTTSTLVDTFSVTTAQEQDWKSPHALATSKSRIPKNARYIVTYNGTDYHLPCQLWGDNNNKVVEFLGNISLYADDTAGFNQTIYNVPFCIISDLDNASSIDVVTSTAETATFKITKVLNNTDTIDEQYLYGSADGPFKYYDGGGSTYSKLSIGNANLVTNRGGIAIGSNNKSSGDFAIAMGYGTLASGNESLSEGNCTLADGFASHAEGSRTDASGDASHAEGYRTEVTSEADYGHAEGSNTVVSGIGGHAEGYSTQAEGLFSHAEGFQTVANHFVQHVFGAFNIADASTADSEEDGNYIEIVGNGNDSNSRSNARTLDWQGNERLKGSITLGADTANETSLSATELQGLKAIDVSNVVRTTDICTDNTSGIARTNSSFGVTATSTGNLRISGAASNHVKAGVDGYKPITPVRQHESVFYGLAKASGVDMASSSNAVGTYTDEAKIAIKQMLGVVDSYDSLVVNVTGTDPVITAQPSYRYNCGEVTSLTITPPSSGTIDFIFTSGTTPTVLDLPNTVKMPSWWVEVEANTIYEMCITDGVYCGVMSWDM